LLRGVESTKRFFVKLFENSSDLWYFSCMEYIEYTGGTGVLDGLITGVQTLSQEPTILALGALIICGVVYVFVRN
jgi:hypothetical protein